MKKKMIWVRGFDLSIRMGYEDLRDNRIFAMAYELGWRDARRQPRKKAGRR
jgi:hypothetical protein